MPSTPPLSCELGVKIELVLTDYLLVLRGGIVECAMPRESWNWGCRRSSDCGELKKRETALAGALVCFGTGSLQLTFFGTVQNGRSDFDWRNYLGVGLSFGDVQ